MDPSSVRLVALKGESNNRSTSIRTQDGLGKVIVRESLGEVEVVFSHAENQGDKDQEKKIKINWSELKNDDSTKDQQ